MRLSEIRYEEIKGEVIDIFSRYDVRCIPISGFELAYKMGIKLIAYSSLSDKKQSAVFRISSDGFYFEPGDGNEYIYYNDNICYRRANMTILHEIGHCVLGHYNGMNHEEAEAEANFFAKYAVAPPPLIHLINPKQPQDIANAFEISYEASEYAMDYYCKWFRNHEQSGVYSECEKQLLRLFMKSA